MICLGADPTFNFQDYPVDFLKRRLTIAHLGCKVKRRDGHGEAKCRILRSQIYRLADSLGAAGFGCSEHWTVGYVNV